MLTASPDQPHSLRGTSTASEIFHPRRMPMRRTVTIALIALAAAGCVGGTLGRYRTYVKPDGTEEQRKVDYEECSTGGRIAQQYIPGLSMLAEAELRDCMAVKGYQKSQQGMVPANAMEAVQPSK